MSGQGFHAHGPHDHELEHAAHNDPGGMAGKLAVVTAVIATVGALFSYMGGLTQAEAGLLKNEAAIKKTEASDQWNYYQSKSGKQNLAEIALQLVSEDKRPKFEKEIERYKDEKTEIKKKAEELEAKSKEADEESAHQMHQHHRWAQATTVLQISIALAAIALLTKKKWLTYGTFGVAIAGTALGVLAWLHV